MGRADYLKKGDWNAICDRCGEKYKASKLQLEWDNLFVCKRCFEVRHPQDFVRGIRDDQTVPIARLQGSPKFITEEVKPEDL